MMIAYERSAAPDSSSFEITAYDRGHVIGFGRVVISGEHGPETTVEVHPDYRARSVEHNIRKLLKLV
jgi:hypothetical protein